MPKSWEDAAWEEILEAEDRLRDELLAADRADAWLFLRQIGREEFESVHRPDETEVPRRAPHTRAWIAHLPPEVKRLYDRRRKRRDILLTSYVPSQPNLVGCTLIELQAGAGAAGEAFASSYKLADLGPSATDTLSEEASLSFDLIDSKWHVYLQDNHPGVARLYLYTKDGLIGSPILVTRRPTPLPIDSPSDIVAIHIEGVPPDDE